MAKSGHQVQLRTLPDHENLAAASWQLVCFIPHSKVVEPKVTAEPEITSSATKIIVRYIVESAVEPTATWSIGGKTVKSGGKYATTITKVSSGYEVAIEVKKVSMQSSWENTPYLGEEISAKWKKMFFFSLHSKKNVFFFHFSSQRLRTLASTNVLWRMTLERLSRLRMLMVGWMPCLTIVDLSHFIHFQESFFSMNGCQMSLCTLSVNTLYQSAVNLFFTNASLV